MNTDRQVYLSARGGGKTTAILQWMRDEIEAGNTPVMICTTVAGAEDHYRLMLGEGAKVESWQFVSLNSLQRLMGRRDKKITIGIDNVDMILQSIVGSYPIDYLTITGRMANAPVLIVGSDGSHVEWQGEGKIQSGQYRWVGP